MPAITKIPAKHRMKPRAAGRNPIASILDNNHRRQQMKAAAKKKAANALKCPNPDCKSASIVEGTCTMCGRVVDDSNIVSEVTFGETSSGAAVVQGSFLGADQGASRIVGGPRRQAGHGSGEARDKSIRDARQVMMGWSFHLNLPEHVINTAHQHFKHASSGFNFVQGRKLHNVIAACVYAACRSQDHCKIMLIDLADIVKEDVFYLGRVFKTLCKTLTLTTKPLYVEDLVYRFAARMEFLEDTTKIATDAMRIVRRMDLDWMVMGRRPSSIVAAALIIAARMHNYRRLPDEMSYISKITTATINERLKEFAFTDAANLTIDDFLSKDILDIKTQHDPPSFYKKTQEYQEKLKAKRELKRKRPVEDEDGEEDDDEQVAGEPMTPARQGNADPDPYPTPSSTLQIRTRVSAPQIDDDGFVVPAIPQKELTEEEEQEQRATIQEARLLDEQGGFANENMELDQLARYGDGGPNDGDINDDEPDILGDEALADALDPDLIDLDVGLPPRKERKGGQGGSSCRPENEDEDPNLAYRTEAWKQDEREMAEEIAEVEKVIDQEINDPESDIHKIFFGEAEGRVSHMMKEFQRRADAKAALIPGRENGVSNNPEVGEDEFADDPEIDAIVLKAEDPDDAAEIADRERNWINENKSYLLKKQAKEFRTKLAAKNPVKTRKPRAKKPRIGEGQTEPAASVAEAVKDTIARRSMKINYGGIAGFLDVLDNESRPGSVTSGSRATSMEPSEDGENGQYKMWGDVRIARRPEDVGGEVDEDQAMEDQDAGEDEYNREEEEEFEDEIDPFADDEPANGDDE